MQNLLVFYFGFILFFSSIVNANQNNSIQLVQIARQTLYYYFRPSPKPSYGQFVQSFKISSAKYKKKFGLFITLSSKGKTRACWGSVQAQYPDLISATVYTTLDALNKEYRYPAIQKNELPNLKIQITLITNIQAISNIQSFNPLTDGLMLRSGAKTAVILPRETIDAHYALVQAKLKAGINQNNYQLYRLKAQIY